MSCHVIAFHVSFTIRLEIHALATVALREFSIDPRIELASDRPTVLSTHPPVRQPVSLTRETDH